MELCSRCDGELNQEEMDDPIEGDDGNICWECEKELNWDTCSLCEETVRNEDLESSVGELIVLFEECGEEFPAGYYRVMRHPFYCQGLIGGGFFFGGAIERVADLDDNAKRAASDSWYPSAALCKECRERIEKMITESVVVAA